MLFVLTPWIEEHSHIMYNNRELYIHHGTSTFPQVEFRLQQSQEQIKSL